jgi:hypothetical protein
MLTSQILCELYSVITNPRRVAVASSPTEALKVILALLVLPGVHGLPIPARAVAGWIELLPGHPVAGGDIFGFFRNFGARHRQSNGFGDRTLVI